MRRTAPPLLAVVATVVLSVAMPVAAYAAAVDSTLLFRFADSRINESSGLGTSSYGDGIVYTHNDSGDTARFFAVNSAGATVAVYTLQGAVNHDWEDMATGTDAAGHPVLYFGDIGDNAATRSEIDVYQVPEPRGPSANVPWVRYRFRYPDGAHNAEAMMVDPRSHRIYIASKAAVGQGELYEAPAAPSTTDINVLTPVRPVPTLTTSGDISPDGQHMVLLTYFRAYWSAGVTGALTAFDVTEQQQDEAIAFTRDEKSVLVGSEGVHSSVYRIGLPAGAVGAAPPPPTPTPTPKPTPTKPSTPSPTPSAKPTPPASSATAPPTSTPPVTSAPASSAAAEPLPTSSSLVSAVPAVSPSASPLVLTTGGAHSNTWWLLIVAAVLLAGLAALLVVVRRNGWWPWDAEGGFRPGLPGRRQ
jgi:hypothetical protein